MGRERVLTDFAKVINSDRYQYTESDIFLMENMEEKEAIFDMYFRKTEDGGFAVVSGVQEVIELIEILNETSEDEKREYFSKIIEEKHLLEYLVKMKFTGNLYAMRDGEIVYPNEPIISIKAPLIQAKILETPILNLMNMQLAIATKASRITRAAHPIPVSSFGSRRAHGFDSAVSGTKASIIGGCLSHSNIVTEYKYGVQSVGTMAHSFIQAFGVGALAEKKAFDTFIKHRRERKANSLILLIDTYNTLGIGLKNAIQSFKDNGIDDSYKGNYGACVDIFGVGDAIAVSKSNPCFGGVYKIVEIDYKPVIKLSEDVIKISNPGFKEVYRIYDKEGFAYADLITLVNNDSDKEKLLRGEDLIIRDEKYEFKSSLLKKGEYTYKKITREFVKNGVVMEESSQLMDVLNSRDYYLDSLNRISEERKRLENPHQYKIDLSKDLLELKYNLIKEIKSQIN